MSLMLESECIRACIEYYSKVYRKIKCFAIYPEYNLECRELYLSRGYEEFNMRIPCHHMVFVKYAEEK